MQLIKCILLGCLMLISAGVSAQTMMLKTLEKEQVYVQMAVSIQEQIIQCFDEKLHATFEYSFRINNGNLQTILRSDSIPEFDININIYADEAAEHIKSNSWTLVFGKLTVSFREWYLNENVDLKNKIMAVFEQEKERHETDYYLNKLPKKPSVIYNNLPYAQLVESIFDDLLSMNMEHYGIDLGPANIYLDVYKDRFIMHARWMDDRARGLGDDYEIGDLSITFQDSPEKSANTLDDHLKIDLITSGNSAAKIEEEIQQMIDNRRNTFLEKMKSE